MIGIDCCLESSANQCADQIEEECESSSNEMQDEVNVVADIASVKELTIKTIWKLSVKTMNRHNVYKVLFCFVFVEMCVV